MQNIYCLLVLVFLTGCVSLPPEPVAAPEPAAVKKNIFPDIDRISIGMSRAEVDTIMGTVLIFGYSVNETSGALEPVSKPAPFRAEKIKSGGKEYEVLYYITSIQNPDGKVSEDELSPIIMINGKVFDKGPASLEKLKSGKT